MRISTYTTTFIVIFTLNIFQTTAQNQNEQQQMGRDYFSKSAGDLHHLTTWGSNIDGSGESPSDFGEGKIFHLANRNDPNEGYFLTGNWTVDGEIRIDPGQYLVVDEHTLSFAEFSGGGMLGTNRRSNLIITGNNGGHLGPLIIEHVRSLTINRKGPGAAFSASPNIHEVLNVVSGEFRTAGSLISNQFYTARVAPVTGSIVGELVVQRFIPARRAWRFLASPVTGSRATVYISWQAGSYLNPPSQWGTHVTGGTRANGFDQDIYRYAGYSLKMYNNPTDSWDPVLNTITAYVGYTPYMIFVRGDRRNTDVRKGANAEPTNTIFYQYGSLRIGDQTIPVNANGFTAVGNPYASPINFATITRNNVANNFYVWDPWMGGVNGVGAWVNVSYNGTGYDVIPTPVSPLSQYIQSGQAFMVRSGNGQPGSLVIKESDKSATPAQNVFRHTENKDEQPLYAPARNTQGLKVRLQKPDSSGYTLLDEVFTSYSREFSNAIDEMDVHKMSNFSENLAIVRKENLLLVERREEIKEADSLQLKLWNTSAGNYSLQFTPIALGDVESVTLEDKYLHSRVIIDPNRVSDWPFEVNTDKISAAADRFRITITKKKALPVTRTSLVRVYPNPVHNSNIYVNFEYIPSGRYNLQLLNSAGQVVYNNHLVLAEGSTRQQLDATQQLPAGVYQLKVTGEGRTHVIKVLKH